MITPQLLFAQAAPVKDVLPWKKAYSYSGFIHAAMLLLIFLMGLRTKHVPTTSLTEIKFIEQPSVPVPATEVAKTVQPQEVAPVQHLVRGGGGGMGGTAPRHVPRGRGFDNLPPTEISSPRGKANGVAVSPQAMSGPIVPIEKLGTLGAKKGALIELAGRTAGGSGPQGGLVVPEGTGDRFNNRPITLAKADYDALRAKEKSIGVPLVSQQVMSEGLGGRSKELMATAIGGKKKAGFEDLKANPLDKDKWGKSKGPFSMEGPLKYRKILKMEMPPYPRWAEEKGIETSVSVRIWVDPKGKVKDNMYLEKTSGYAEIDSLAMQYLARFIFVKIPDDQTQEDEWGVATFRFELKK